MYIQPLTNENVSDFIQYCYNYGKEHDESFLPNNEFKISSEESCFLLYNQINELIGVASLMIKKGRFRILHSINPVYNNYKCLVDMIMTETKGLENMYLFIPENKLEVRNILKNLGFEVQRYTWYLERASAKVEDIIYSNDIQVNELKSNEEDIWCEIINKNFIDHQGFTRLQVEDVKKMKEQNSDTYSKMLILWKDKKPIGTVQLEIDLEDGMRFGYISWLSIIKSYRGLGLGRDLLKYSIKVVSMNDVDKVGLVVHSTNNRALQLYQSEGFKKKMSLVCYNKKLV